MSRSDLAGGARQRRGFTMLEVVVAAFVLGLAAVVLFGLMRTAGRSIRTVDQRRETRYLISEVMERIAATDFLTLYQEFGVEPDVSGRIRQGLWRPEVVREDEVFPERNPLLLSSALKQTLERLGWETSLEFRFMTREELGANEDNRVRSGSGILHLQGGWATLTIDTGSRQRTLIKPLYCPLILGRPGLALSQCPALNEGLRQGLLKKIP